MQVKKKQELLASLVEQRDFRRNAANLSGNLIVPTEKVILPCQVLNLSAGGASIRCNDPLPAHTYVILCINGFGRIEAITRRSVDGELGLQFVFKKTKRHQLLDDISNQAHARFVRKAGLRRHVRLPLTSKVRLTLPGGEELSCEVIDVSLRGLSLRTEARPAINDLISIGQKYGRIARHHSEGFAVEFADVANDPFHDK